MTHDLGPLRQHDAPLIRNVLSCFRRHDISGLRMPGIERFVQGGIERRPDAQRRNDRRWRLRARHHLGIFLNFWRSLCACFSGDPQESARENKSCSEFHHGASSLPRVLPGWGLRIATPIPQHELHAQENPNVTVLFCVGYNRYRFSDLVQNAVTVLQLYSVEPISPKCQDVKRRPTASLPRPGYPQPSAVHRAYEPRLSSPEVAPSPPPQSDSRRPGQKPPPQRASSKTH